ncbi:MAG: putative Ig domain-containing protein, partial [Bacteroidota bacterium]
CTDLLAEYTRIASTDDGNATTDDYEVCSVPYNPTFPFTGGTVIAATGDDSWSPIVTLPFTFNFYGNCYNNVLVGTNGVITFDIGPQVPLGYCNWPFTATIPGAGFPIKNAIYGVYQDTNIASPPVTNTAIQNVNYYILDSGPNAAPNRVFVANFNELPQYSCNASVGFQTSQIVIHETTNIIEVLVSRRTSCTTWNSGSGLIGIQNAAGTLAEVPPGRNTGTWGAVNESWRFIPKGEPAPITTQLTWELNGNPIGAVNENPLNVCPTTAGTYSAVVSYRRCDGTTAEVRKDLVVDVAPPLPAADPVDITLCTSDLPPYTINIDQNALILSTIPLADQGNYSIKYYENLTDARNDAPTNIDFLSVADLATYQVTVVPRTIYVRIEDLVTTGCFNIRSFVIDVVSSPSGTFSYPGSPYCDNDSTPKLPTLFALTSGGTFSAAPAGLSINPGTGAIDGSLSTAGVYTVTYDIPATALCPAYSTTATVEIVGCSCTVTASSSSQTVCVNTAITPITYTSSTGATSASVPAADLPPGVTGTFSAGTFTISGTPTVPGTYTFTVTCLTGATDSCSISTTIIVNAQPNAGLDGSTTVCENSSSLIDLFSLISGEQGGGSWT